MKMWLSFPLPEGNSHIDGLVQERRNSIANALELRLSWYWNRSPLDQFQYAKHIVSPTWSHTYLVYIGFAFAFLFEFR